MTLTVNPLRAPAKMTYWHAKVQGQQSGSSKDRVETNGRTDRGECITSHTSAVGNYVGIAANFAVWAVTSRHVKVGSIPYFTYLAYGQHSLPSATENVLRHYFILMSRAAIPGIAHAKAYKFCHMTYSFSVGFHIFTNLS